MKLYGGWKIIAGLIFFLLVVTFPFWYGGLKATPPPDLKLDTPAIGQLAEKRCIEDAAFMRANHMKLLVKWQDLVVREGIRSYAATDGKVYQISLTASCLGCHSNKDKFCDRCHDYTGVKPKCYSCHILPKEVP